MTRNFFRPSRTFDDCDHACAEQCTVQFPAILRQGDRVIQLYPPALIVGRGRHEFCEQCGAIRFYGVWMPPAGDVVIGRKTPVHAVERYRKFRSRSKAA